jgi:DNA-binding transcriptional ArsR family regulator
MVISVQEMSDRLAALEERLAALEERVSCGAPALPVPPDYMTTNVSRRGNEEQPAATGAVNGTLMYGGSVLFAGQQRSIQRQQGLAPLFELAPESLAQVFTGLANPHRIIILRTLCQAPRTSQQLQELLGMSSPGQLYHHLRELQSAGLIVQRDRGAYTLDPAKVVPICVALMAASHLMLPGRGEAPQSHRDGTGADGA